MIYLDNGATTLHKPLGVQNAVNWALQYCGNPGRGGHRAAMLAADTVLRCRQRSAQLFECEPEQVVFTSSCTHGLNTAIRSLVRPGGRVLISGFEHNAVTRPLYALRAEVMIAGRRLFDWEDTLEQFERGLEKGPDAAVFTHVSNVFGYRLPAEQMAELCVQYGVPFIVDAAQSAGTLPVSLQNLKADFIAMPGHKGLLGPQGTGILLCGRLPEPLLFGGTGSLSKLQEMPDFLPDRGEAGTLNVPGIAGLSAGLQFLLKQGIHQVAAREHTETERCIRELRRMNLQVFAGPHQAGTLSFVPPGDCQMLADALGRKEIAVRAGLHCAPLAHESAGTLKTGTVRLSFGWDITPNETEKFLFTLKNLL